MGLTLSKTPAADNYPRPQLKISTAIFLQKNTKYLQLWIFSAASILAAAFCERVRRNVLRRFLVWKNTKIC